MFYLFGQKRKFIGFQESPEVLETLNSEIVDLVEKRHKLKIYFSMW